MNQGVIFKVNASDSEGTDLWNELVQRAPSPWKSCWAQAVTTGPVYEWDKGGKGKQMQDPRRSWLKNVIVYSSWTSLWIFKLMNYYLSLIIETSGIPYIDTCLSIVSAPASPLTE